MLHVVFAIITRHLHRLELQQLPWYFARVAGICVTDLAHAPDACHQQFRIGLYKAWIDNDLADAEIGERCLIQVGFVIKHHLHTVDNPMAPFLAAFRLDKIGFLAMHIVVCKNGTHSIHTRLDTGLVGVRGICAEQELEHIRGHQCIALDLVHQILADGDPGEHISDLSVQRGQGIPIRVVFRTFNPTVLAHTLLIHCVTPYGRFPLCSSNSVEESGIVGHHALFEEVSCLLVKHDQHI